MSTINIVLMVVLAAFISLLFGYSVGKAAGKKENLGQLKSFMEMLNKTVAATNELKKKSDQT